LSNQKDEFVTKLRILKENVADENDKIAENLRQMREELEQTLREAIAGLSDEKLSRDSMAQMLLDVAMKIRGQDINSLLPQEESPSKK